MNLEQITVKIRPRNQWEAIDMGIIIARNWFKQLWFLWISVALPLTLTTTLLSFALPGSTPKWSLIIFWLCKPLYEPLLLHWTSRALFGEQLTIRKTINEVKKTISLKRILSVYRYRLSPTRSFTFPILLLEELTGKKRKTRSALLSKGYETAVYLTGSFFCIELILSLSLLTVFFWFIPEELRWIDFGNFVFRADSWLTLAAYCIICSFVAPFYICGGFMLYISRRVELEAWDIEIGFKRIEQRLRERKNNIVKTMVCLIFCCIPIASVVSTDPANAGEPDPETAKKAIIQVMQQKDFGEKKTIYRWVPKQEKKAENDSSWLQFFEHLFKYLATIAEKLTKHIASIIKFAVWIFAGGVLAFILLRYFRISKWFSRHLQTSQEIHVPPTIMFGMDIRPESLPEDIESACIVLLEKGEKRKALSLLYRSSLSRLVNDLNLQIKPSHTEQECCDTVISYRPKTESSFFNKLTAIWLTTAYGHREPDTGSCRELINRWQNIFGVGSCQP